MAARAVGAASAIFRVHVRDGTRQSPRPELPAVRARGSQAEGGSHPKNPTGASYLLPKRESWPHADERLESRISIEDPFETHDAPEPTRRHDCAGSVTKAGMEALLHEWESAALKLRTSADEQAKAVDLMARGEPGAEAHLARAMGAFGEVFTPTTTPTTPTKGVRSNVKVR